MLKRGFNTLFGLIFGFIEGVINFFTSQWSQFHPIGQALFALAIVMIGVDAAISFKFGLTQTPIHAVGFAGLAVALFLLPDAAITEWRKGNKPGGLWLGVACVPIGAVCLWTHVGYSSGVRLGDIQQDGFKHAAYVSATTALQDKRGTLAMLKEQRASAKSKLEQALERNKGWTVAVDPTAMQSALDAMDTKIANEGKRVRCGDKCEKLKVERGQLAAAIALATQENGLAESIAALEKEIEAKASEVAALAPPTSTTVSQVKMAAKLVNVAAYYTGSGTEDAVLNPSAFQQDIANTAAAGISSLAFLLVSATLMTGAGFNRKSEYMHGRKDPPERVAPVRPSTSFASSPALMPPPAAAVALAAVQERRDRVAGAMAMRQARVDGALLAAA